MKRIIPLFFMLSFIAGNSQITTNLLANYDFDGNVNDQSGNGFNATAHNVTYIDDRFGIPNSACYFNGIDSYVEFPNIDEMKTPLPVSFSFWIRYDSPNYQHQALLNTSFENNRSTGVWFNSTSETGQYAVNFGDGNYAYTPYTRRTYVSNSAIDLYNWHHVTVVVTSATDMKIYFDKFHSGGYYNGEGGAIQYSLTPGCIGRHDRDLNAPADYFMGAIDDFRYYNRALTQQDVNDIYNLSVDHNDLDMSANLYPNPVTNELHISIADPTNITAIEIYDAIGKKVYSSAFSDIIDTSSFEKGLYILQLSSPSGMSAKKFIKS